MHWPRVREKRPTLDDPAKDGRTQVGGTVFFSFLQTLLPEATEPSFAFAVHVPEGKVGRRHFSVSGRIFSLLLMCCRRTQESTWWITLCPHAARSGTLGFSRKVAIRAQCRNHVDRYIGRERFFMASPDVIDARFFFPIFLLFARNADCLS